MNASDRKGLNENLIDLRDRLGKRGMAMGTISSQFLMFSMEKLGA